jgi:DNA-binding NarL/FixJ family response regulator
VSTKLSEPVRTTEKDAGNINGNSAATRQRTRPKVLIADSDPLAARVVRDTLQEDGGFVIPGVAKDGLEAVELARHYRPDVALVEVALPIIDGIAVIRQIAEDAPGVRVVVFSQHDQEDIQLDALRAGAVGFVSK